METGLCYNRFRYYNAEEGMYVSQDPIRLDAGIKFYYFVRDVNEGKDPLGLTCTNTFPHDPNELTEILGVQPRVSTTPDGTVRMVWEPNSLTRIRYESHPHGLVPGDAGFNPRHHGPHYHVETRPSATMGWGNPGVTKAQPPGYTPGSGTGFIPGESFPGT